MSVEPQGPIVTPDPKTLDVWLAQARIFIGVLVGLGIGGPWLGKITDQQLSAEISAAITVFSLLSWVANAIWSRYVVHSAAREKHATAVASAIASSVATQDAGRPVAVTVAAKE